MRYRTQLRDVVAEVIRDGMDQAAASRHVHDYATLNVAETDRASFIEAAETELLSLHEGNFARYGVRPSEYQAWREVWEHKAEAE